MSELIPIPLSLQLTRAFAEYEGEGKIFDLPKAKFFRGVVGVDTSVTFHGQRAANPVGPAAGPHDQLVQNIVLSWLAGSRIIELKTVQILDELKIPRPCIDATNVGYNVEWSQELKLEQSLREYVGAMMFIEILKASRLLGDEFSGAFTDTIYDMSVGYSLDGIRSPRVRQWIESMKDASAIIDELRASLTGPWAQYRDLPFPTRISDTITLSTFHGCPAHEIEGIVDFLLTEMDVHVCVKLNPTLLGFEQVRYLLHDVLGYHDIQVTADAFEHDLQFADAMTMLPRLAEVARLRAKRLAVKFSNTLVVKNHRKMFSDETMYMSGPPLHVITLNLVKKFREQLGAMFPTSFSAGLDQHNVCNAVAMGFVPVTTCTDLLRPGGYARLPKYLENLGAKMREIGATRIPDFVVRYENNGQPAIERIVGDLGKQWPSGGDALNLPLLSMSSRLKAWLAKPGASLKVACTEIESEFLQKYAPAMPPRLANALRKRIGNLEQLLAEAAGVLNTPSIVDRTTSDARYHWDKNKAVPRKIGSKLWLYDCISCDKCVPVCPNDANFVYENEAAEITYQNYEISGAQIRAVPGGTFKVTRSHQLANYADACNECGNCDVFCPEDGGPQIEKPRFFGSLESYERYRGRQGFFLEFNGVTATLHGTIAGKTYQLTCDSTGSNARFDDGSAEVELRASDHTPVKWTLKVGVPSHTLEMLPYFQLKFLMDAVSNPRRAHYANVAALAGANLAKKGAVQR